MTSFASEHELTSGGEREGPDAPVPVLCLTRDIARAMYTRSLADFLSKRGLGSKEKGWRYIAIPTMDRWMMTSTSTSGMQRTAEDRFCVVARIGIERDI